MSVILSYITYLYLAAATTSTDLTRTWGIEGEIMNGMEHGGIFELIIAQQRNMNEIPISSIYRRKHTCVV